MVRFLKPASLAIAIFVFAFILVLGACAGGAGTPGDDPANAGARGESAGGRGAAPAGPSGDIQYSPKVTVGEDGVTKVRAPNAPITIGAAKIVARVNGSEIAGSDLNRAYLTNWQRIAQSGAFPPEKEQRQIMSDVLDAMIGARLLMQAAAERGIEIDKAEIDRQYSTLQSQAASEEAFLQNLKTAGMNPDSMREQLKEKFLISQYLGKFVHSDRKKITTTEEEAKIFYEANKKPYHRPEQVRARHILRRVPPNATKKQRTTERAKIQEALEKVNSGEEFAKVAMTYSNDITAPEGGDLGYFARGKFVANFEDTAFSLEKGEVSDIVETRFGYHVIMLEDKHAGGIAPFEDVKDQIIGFLNQGKMQSLVDREVQKLRAGAKIEMLLPIDEASAPEAPAKASAG